MSYGRQHTLQREYQDWTIKVRPLYFSPGVYAVKCTKEGVDLLVPGTFVSRVKGVAVGKDFIDKYERKHGNI